MKKITFSFNWWRTDGKPMNNEHRQFLEESAFDRALELWKSGFTSGELNETVDEDTDKEINYRGHWSVSTNYEN